MNEDFQGTGTFRRELGQCSRTTQLSPPGSSPPGPRGGATLLLHHSFPPPRRPPGRGRLASPPAEDRGPGRCPSIPRSAPSGSSGRRRAGDPSPPLDPQATARGRGLENCDTGAEAGGSTACGGGGTLTLRPEPGARDRASAPTALPREGSCGPQAALRPRRGP